MRLEAVRVVATPEQVGKRLDQLGRALAPRRRRDLPAAGLRDAVGDRPAAEAAGAPDRAIRADPVARVTRAAPEVREGEADRQREVRAPRRRGVGRDGSRGRGYFSAWP
ncbi:MAG TPA: hypothetical protein VG650_03655 [Mycobacteriales bacterium]|nr:hypothetical protein [Mycobacteriales bacterium]